jgi:hypothetical protein
LQAPGAGTGGDHRDGTVVRENRADQEAGTAVDAPGRAGDPPSPTPIT